MIIIHTIIFYKTKYNIEHLLFFFYFLCNGTLNKVQGNSDLRKQRTHFAFTIIIVRYCI